MGDFKIRFTKYPLRPTKVDFNDYVKSTPPLVDTKKLDYHDNKRVSEFLDELFRSLLPNEYRKISDLYNGIMANKDKPLRIAIGSLKVDLPISDQEIETLKSIVKPDNSYVFEISTNVEKDLTREDIEKVVELARKHNVPLKPYVNALGKEIDSMEKFNELQKRASKKSWVKVLDEMEH